jgi:hypothetical protein
MVTNCRREKLSPEEAETEYVRSEKVLIDWLKSNGAKWHQNHFEDLKAFTTKTSEHKWHNTDKQILPKKFKEL